MNLGYGSPALLKRIMKMNIKMTGCLVVLAAGLLGGNYARADVQLVSFHNFTADEMYGSWPAAKVVSGETNYVITATGYGSNYKYLGNPPGGDVTGCTNLQLKVTLSGPPRADGQLGVLVNLVDGDGTEFVYAWYGQKLGYHVLTMPVDFPSRTNAVGSVSGLDLTSITHLHLQLDPGQLGTNDAYTVSWEDLSLVGSAKTNRITPVAIAAPASPSGFAKEQQ